MDAKQVETCVKCHCCSNAIGEEQGHNVHRENGGPTHKPGVSTVKMLLIIT